MQNIKATHPSVGNLPDILLFVVILTSLIVEWVWFRMSVISDNASILVQSIKAVGEFMPILLPYWFLPPKWRRSILVPFWIISLYFPANLFYFRFYSSLIPFSSLLYTGNMDSTLFSSVEALWATTDLLYLILPVAVTVSAFLLPQKRKFSKQVRLTASGITLLMLLFVQTIYIRAHIRLWERNGISRPLGGVCRSLYGTQEPVVADFFNCGFLTTMIKGIAFESLRQHKPIEYTADELEEISSYLSRLDTLRIPADSVFTANRNKNLIFIIVESLNSEVVGMHVAGKPLTPTLNNLLKEAGTISALHVVTQVGDGGSSDGQMLYNIGMLPMLEGAASMQLTYNSYHSLASMLGKKQNVEFIRENSASWNHDVTNRQYGYDKLYSKTDYPAYADDIASDQAVFELALKEMVQMPQPFFAEITTLSMHLPFKEDKMPRDATILSEKGIPTTERNYYNSVRYFDRCLGDFLQRLKESGLYEQSVVVIASDHNVKFSSDDYVNGTDVTSGEIVFIAANTGRNYVVDSQVGQSDIFPTILEIMGAADAAPWKGLGLSVLNPHSGGAIDRQGRIYGTISDSVRVVKAPNISDLMLRGDWMGRFGGATAQ